MPANNQILRTTDGDIERLNQLVVSTTVRNLRVLKERVERRIVIFERRLVDLYSNEKLVKARILNNAVASEIDSKYAAGLNTQVKAIQSFKNQLFAPDPHRSYAYNKHKIYATIPGITELDAELNRVNNEIQMVMAQVSHFKKTLANIDKRLDDGDEKEKTNLLDKTFGRVLPPTRADLEKDKIARARINNIFLLQKLAVQYFQLTLDPYTNTTKYPDEAKLPRDLQVMRQVFYAHAQSKGLMVTNAESGETQPLSEVLNFEDPGDTGNIQILDRMLAAERVAGRNTRTTTQIDQFVKDTLALANDPYISAGIERKTESGLAADNSVRAQTESYPAAAMALGDHYIGSFELPDITKGLRKWWKGKNEKLYKGLPTCPNVDKSEFETSTDAKESAKEVQDELTKAQGELAYRDAIGKAQAFIEEELAKKLGGLPSDAPEWVTVYVTAYEDGYRGSFTYEGTQHVGTRATDTDEDISAEIARRYGPSGSLEASLYNYYEELGYDIKYPDGSTGFVPIAAWANFQKGEDANGNNLDFDVSTVEATLNGEWVTYILWV